MMKFFKTAPKHGGPTLDELFEVIHGYASVQDDFQQVGQDMLATIETTTPDAREQFERWVAANRPESVGRLWDEAPLPGLVLPPKADPRRDWEHIKKAVRQEFNAPVARLDLDADGRWVASPLTTTTFELATGTKPTDGERIQAVVGRAGQSLIAFDPYGQRAMGAELDEDTVKVRRYVAAFLGVREWEVRVTLCHKEGRIEHVIVERMPAMGGQEKRLKTMKEVVLGLPNGSNGWRLTDLPQFQSLVMTYGQPARLPDIVPLPDILPDSVRPEEWASLPVGLGTDGEPVIIDLAAGPHGLVVGPTGSGKTVLLLAWAVQALCRGHEVIVVDPTKAGLDFATIKPWTSLWADDLSTAQAVMERVYEEVTRRKRVLQTYGEVKWADLPIDVRRSERINPTTVILDEYASMVMEEPVPKGLDKAHPYVMEANDRNASRSIISSIVGRVAREARFVGIHLVIGLQRPDAAIVSGEMRSNLTSGVQLSAPGKPPSREALTMLFPGETSAAVDELLRALDDGHSRGLGAIAADGGQAAGLRVAYAPARTIPDMLTERGIPEAALWTGVKKASKPGEATPVENYDPFAAFDAEAVVDSGFELSSDDDIWG